MREPQCLPRCHLVEPFHIQVLRRPLLPPRVAKVYDPRHRGANALCPILDVLRQGWGSTVVSRMRSCWMSSNPTAQRAQNQKNNENGPKRINLLCSFASTRMRISCSVPCENRFARTDKRTNDGLCSHSNKQPPADDEQPQVECGSPIVCWLWLQLLRGEFPQ
jgi:hypothetical protein